MQVLAISYLQQLRSTKEYRQPDKPAKRICGMKRSLLNGVSMAH